MIEEPLGFLRFEEGYFERIWGGEKLRSIYGKPAPEGKPIGEAWLISDHEQHESVVAEGPQKGKNLRQLIEEYPGQLLGNRAKLTIHERFPLLLKILDAKEALSVQVHPDDERAAQLGEPDVGKTEMWHVLQAEPGARLICGLDPAVTPETFSEAIQSGEVERMMQSYPVEEGESVFVSAGTVHAIGAGIVLAEIQQNSDLTYRMYDWKRVDSSGKPRALHVEKALGAIKFGEEPQGKTPAPPISENSGSTLLAKCPYFQANLIQVAGLWEQSVGGETFHIALVTSGSLTFFMDDEAMRLNPGEAVLIPGRAQRFSVEGVGAFLDYSIPEN